MRPEIAAAENRSRSRDDSSTSVDGGFRTYRREAKQAAPHHFENEMMVGCRGDSTILFFFECIENQAMAEPVKISQNVCTNCGVPAWDHFCGACGHIQPVGREMDYF